jgi:hypothetical protein
VNEPLVKPPCLGCNLANDKKNWKPRTFTTEKPLKLSVEEYMERIGKGEMLVEQRLNGTTAEDLHNVISKPKHYMLFEEEGIEVRHVIAKLVQKLYRHSGAMFEDKENPLFESDYVQLMQYLMRFMDKNGVEDLKKARWYLDKMIESY